MTAHLASKLKIELTTYLFSLSDPFSGVIQKWALFVRALSENCESRIIRFAPIRDRAQGQGPPAGVERLFSKAGAMHHNLKGSMDDGSLEHSLIAMANTE